MLIITINVNFDFLYIKFNGFYTSKNFKASLVLKHIKNFVNANHLINRKIRHQVGFIVKNFKMYFGIKLYF